MKSSSQHDCLADVFSGPFCKSHCQEELAGNMHAGPPAAQGLLEPRCATGVPRGVAHGQACHSRPASLSGCASHPRVSGGTRPPLGVTARTAVMKRGLRRP